MEPEELQEIETEEDEEIGEPVPERENLPRHARGPVFKSDGRTAWTIWHLYNDLERCSPDRVPTLRAAIAYLGGRLDVRSVPPSIKGKVPGDIPVRKL